MILDHLADRKGFYQVGDRRFLNKIPAVIEASRLGVFPQWFFLNDQIDRYDWKRPPVTSLAELYRDRCQQLRERYDYLTLSYSGGADSDNILRSFLQNNIRLDEILVLWPVQKSEAAPADPNDLSKENWMSEWQLNLRPRLRWLTKYHPEIKITIRDWAQELPRFSIGEDFLLQRASMTSPYGILRWHDRDRLDSLAHKRGVLIYGTDKPRLCIQDGWYKIYFLDVAVQANQPQLDEYSEIVELFYWSPDSLDLICKQAHTVINFFQAHPQFNHMLTWPIQPQFHEDYRNIVKSLIYPGEYNAFQVRHFAYDQIVDNTELQNDFHTLTDRAWQNLIPSVQDRFLSNWDGQSQIVGMINGMWPLRPILHEQCH